MNKQKKKIKNLWEKRQTLLTDSEELASGMIYHKNRAGGNKRKIPFSPAQKSTVPKSHTHKKGQNIYGSFLREDCGEDIYI